MKESRRGRRPKGERPDGCMTLGVQCPTSVSRAMERVIAREFNAARKEGRKARYINKTEMVLTLVLDELLRMGEEVGEGDREVMSSTAQGLLPPEDFPERKKAVEWAEMNRARGEYIRKFGRTDDRKPFLKQESPEEVLEYWKDHPEWEKELS